MPSLIRSEFRVAPEDRPADVVFSLAVSESGTVAYPVARDAGSRAIMVLSATGERIALWGRTGDGPGELRNPSNLRWVGDDLLLASRPGVVGRYSADGTLRGEYRVEPLELLISLGGDFADELVPHSGPEGVRLEIVRFPLTGGPRQVLVAQADSTLHAATTRGGGFGFGFVPYHGTAGRILIGDGMRYIIESIDLAMGDTVTLTRRLLPRTRGPTEIANRREELEQLARFTGPNGRSGGPRDLKDRLERAATEPVPHFERSPFGIDDRGRVWVFGLTADSTFADVFDGPRFLGRITLPCFDRIGRRSLNGRWLVLSCESSETAVDGTVDLRMFQVVG
jgi:hypothetical protein